MMKTSGEHQEDDDAHQPLIEEAHDDLLRNEMMATGTRSNGRIRAKNYRPIVDSMAVS